MKLVPQRISEYVRYHINGDCQCNGQVLSEYCSNHKIQKGDKIMIAYFYSITYSVPTAIYLYQRKNKIFENIDLWVDNNQNKLIFQSDRKYMKYQGRFKVLLKQFEQLNFDFIMGEKIDIEQALQKVQGWKQFGRFASFLFVETFITMENLGYINTNTIDWEKGDTATSGIMNVFGYDKSADYFDKNNKLPSSVKTETLDKMLQILQKRIAKLNGDNNVTKVETSLCAYRKHYKGTRYNGYYLDRQLQEIYYYLQIGERAMAKELFSIRLKLFNRKHLGEVCGWKGIRNELKKEYLRTGKIL